MRPSKCCGTRFQALVCLAACRTPVSKIMRTKAPSSNLSRAFVQSPHVLRLSSLEGLFRKQIPVELSSPPRGASLLAAATAAMIALKAAFTHFPSATSARCRKFDWHASVSSACYSRLLLAPWGIHSVICRRGAGPGKQERSQLAGLQSDTCAMPACAGARSQGRNSWPCCAMPPYPCTKSSLRNGRAQPRPRIIVRAGNPDLCKAPSPLHARPHGVVRSRPTVLKHFLYRQMLHAKGVASEHGPALAYTSHRAQSCTNWTCAI